MNKSPQLSFKTPADIKIFRDRHGMNQTGFWSRVGVTQSGGSRYESGRNIPRPVQLLLTVTYGTPTQLNKAVEYLRGWKD